MSFNKQREDLECLGKLIRYHVSGKISPINIVHVIAFCCVAFIVLAVIIFLDALTMLGLWAMIVISLSLVSLLTTCWGAAREMREDGEATWQGYFMNKLADYSPLDPEGYGDFVEKIVRDGLCEDAAKAWMANESTAIDEKEASYSEAIKINANAFSESEMTAVHRLTRKKEFRRNLRRMGEATIHLTKEMK